MSHETLYLAGPMRGLPRFNFDTFRQAREHLRSIGYTVVCPAERDERRGFDPTPYRGTEHLEFIGFDLADALDDCFRQVLAVDAVALLPGWTRSEGARAEALVARLTDRPLYEYHRHRPTPLERIERHRITTRVETT